MILEEVRSSLLKEAKMSPNLLSDLAGLEHYIAESYHNRSFAELLQNADDADSTKFIIDIAENYILIANDGRYFNKKDFESLCRSTRSFKKRGEKIGYRGIGFKSVVGFSGKLHLLSGDIKTTFSKKLTKNEMSADINVPLIRIPHPMNNLDANVMKLVNKILNKGYKTIFIFENINKQQIETEIDNFNSSSLLFLNNINKIELNTEKNIEIIEAKRKIISPQISKSIISKGDKIKRWLTIGSETQESISFSLNVNGGINRLKDEESLVYAFLPTEEKTGLGIKINGDVSTDPSRRKVILDNNTQDVIRSVSKIISKLFIECLKNEFEIANEKEIINALLPYIDPRSIAYKKKTFSTELLKNIKKIINNELEDLILKPSWINSLDFEKIAKELNLWMVDRDIAGLNNLKNLLSYFGAKEINNNSIINNINKFNLSIRGYAEFISLLINKYVVREILIRDLSLDMKIWIGKDDNVYSLNEINKDNIMVNNEFIELILEKVSYAEYKSFISSIMEYNNLNIKFPKINLDREKTQIEFTDNKNIQQDDEEEKEVLSITKWRSAEQQVCKILNYKNYNVKDVSKQNLGFDIEGIDPDGNDIYFEVKSVDNFGQSFIITNNEWSAAKDKGGKYVITIIKQEGNKLKVAFLKNPLKKLNMDRKCRQWVWECTNYSFDTQVFKLSKS